MGRTDVRALIKIEGLNRKEFLNRLVTNDVMGVSKNHTIYAALLNPQGKYLHDFFIIEILEYLLIDIAADEKEEFMKRLRLYKLKSNIEITDASQNWKIQYLKLKHLPDLLPQFAENTLERGDTFYDASYGWFIVDPRHRELGLRWLSNRQPTKNVPPDYYFTSEEQEKNRILLSIPKGRLDLIPDKSFPLENNFDGMGAISWKKGCYVGQEVTARMKYRLPPKKKLFPIWLEHPIISERHKIMTNDHQEVGEICSTHMNFGLALWRLEYIINIPQPDSSSFFVLFQEKQVEIRILQS